MENSSREKLEKYEENSARRFWLLYAILETMTLSRDRQDTTTITRTMLAGLSRAKKEFFRDKLTDRFIRAFRHTTLSARFIFLIYIYIYYSPLLQRKLWTVCTFLHRWQILFRPSLISIPLDTHSRLYSVRRKRKKYEQEEEEEEVVYFRIKHHRRVYISFRPFTEIDPIRNNKRCLKISASWR